MLRCMSTRETATKPSQSSEVRIWDGSERGGKKEKNGNETKEEEKRHNFHVDHCVLLKEINGNLC